MLKISNSSKHQEVNRLLQEVHWPINEVDKYKSTAHFALHEWSYYFTVLKTGDVVLTDPGKS